MATIELGSRWPRVNLLCSSARPADFHLLTVAHLRPLPLPTRSNYLSLIGGKRSDSPKDMEQEMAQEADKSHYSLSLLMYYIVLQEFHSQAVLVEDALVSVGGRDSMQATGRDLSGRGSRTEPV